eukprot:snap_masked-scaffold1019_size70576-processed-gene-0.8 protein:Tk09584 transcript:snap_masked-scaffold1019_size70576-processed-gene-0.8-mRNA-1 annotation:"hypothetical protein DAPPUDRAFT_261119"
MKQLVNKTGGNIHNEAFRIALLEWRNTPSELGRSPAQVLFGRPLRGCLPVHPSQLGDPENVQAHREAKACLAQKRKRKHDRTAQSLPALAIGDSVRVQDRVTSKWDKCGVITSRRASGSYVIRMENGSVTTRNRRLLRLQVNLTETTAAPNRRVTVSDRVDSFPGHSRSWRRGTTPKRAVTNCSSPTKDKNAVGRGTGGEVEHAGPLGPDTGWSVHVARKKRSTVTSSSQSAMQRRSGTRGSTWARHGMVHVAREERRFTKARFLGMAHRPEVLLAHDRGTLPAASNDR